MEHVVQFGVSLDDSAIERVVIERAAGQVKAELMEKITCNMPRDKWNEGKLDWPRAAADMLEGWFDDHRDELLDSAAEKLASKAVRSKAWRERVAGVAEGAVG